MRRAADAVITAALVLPVGAYCALAAGTNCNHIQGNIEVAEKGTPRGDWCTAIQWHGRWLLLVVVPPAATFLLALAAGRHRWARWAAWGAGAALALVPVLILGSRRPLTASSRACPSPW
jgi:hypothetical protein